MTSKGAGSGPLAEKGTKGIGWRFFTVLALDEWHRFEWNLLARAAPEDRNMPTEHNQQMYNLPRAAAGMRSRAFVKGIGQVFDGKKYYGVSLLA